MSADLRLILGVIAEEECRDKELDVEERMDACRSLLLKIAKMKKFDLGIWVAGSEAPDVKEYESDLNVLERGNLIRGQIKYTHRNVYREYYLTDKGAELAEKLSNEKTITP